MATVKSPNKEEWFPTNKFQNIIFNLFRLG